MTRKHFKALADALMGTRPLNSEPESLKRQWTATARAIADCCKSFNSGFDRERFYEACGGLYY